MYLILKQICKEINYLNQKKYTRIKCPNLGLLESRARDTDKGVITLFGGTSSGPREEKKRNEE